MTTTKEQQRTDLHKTIWSIAEDLRGSIDGWGFKQYVLNTLFYRFISENLSNYLADLESDPNFDYSKMPDEQAEYGRKATVDEKGFFILPSELFCNILDNVDKDDMSKTEDGKDLNELLEQVFKNIDGSAVGTASEDDIKGLFDDMDVNSAKLGGSVIERNKKLRKFIEKVGSLDFGGAFQDNSIDAFGDVYEFLMTMYASNGGKSGGEFFAPQEVGEFLARIVIADKDSVNKVYDPGVLYRGGTEKKIREYLIKNNFVDAVIQLPPDLFFGVTIATCILVLKKNKTTSDIIFIDASEEFTRYDSKNKLMPENIDRIVNAVLHRSEDEYFSKLVSNDDVLENDANLSVSSYVEKKDEREEIDIVALNAEIARIVAREDELRKKIDAIVAELEGVA